MSDPDLKLDGFEVHFHDWEFPPEGWLNVTARMKASGALVETGGPIIRMVELESFACQLRAMIKSLNGSAKLECLEPNLRLSLAMQSLGHVSAELAITHDHLTQRHEFEFGLDQSYLPPLLRACEAVLARVQQGPTST